MLPYVLRTQLRCDNRLQFGIGGGALTKSYALV